MQLFESVFHRHRDRTVLAVLIAASFALLSLRESTQLDVVRVLLGQLLRPAQNAVDWIGDYAAVRAENERLRRMLVTLSLERERLMQFRDERERLRRLAEFKEEQTYRLVPAEVIGRDFDRIQTSLVIDKGAREGLRERMPVFSYDGRYLIAGLEDGTLRFFGLQPYREKHMNDLTGTTIERYKIVRDL